MNDLYLYGKFDDEHRLIIENQIEAKNKGLPEVEIDVAWDGTLWEKGYAPEKPQEVINQERITELKQFLANTDYCILKIEEAVDEAEKQDLREKYADIIKARREARIEINNLEK